MMTVVVVWHFFEGPRCIFFISIFYFLEHGHHPQSMHVTHRPLRTTDPTEAQSGHGLSIAPFIQWAISVLNPSILGSAIFSALPTIIKTWAIFLFFSGWKEGLLSVCQRDLSFFVDRKNKETRFGYKRMSVTKPGIPFDEISARIRTFDLILFRGSDFVSKAIAEIENAYSGVNDFTHVGIAIRARDIDELSPLWRSETDALYIFESTASGALVDGCAAVTDHRGHLGVQLRNLPQVVKHYDAKPATRMAWMPLQESVRAQIPPHAVDAVLNRYMYVAYNASCIGLLAAAFPLVRRVRDCWAFRKLRNLFCRCCCCGARPNTWLFCSELCAQIYKDIGVFPRGVESADVLPVDFLPAETTPILTASSSEQKVSGETVDTDNQVPWVFGTLIRFRAALPPPRIESADDLVNHPKDSPL
jgi:hypothetical protein